LGGRDADGFKVERLLRRLGRERVNSAQFAYQLPSGSPVGEVFLECTFDGCVVGLFSADNDDGNVKRVVKSLGIDDVESCEGRS
jgi:hypothetical protein